MSFFGCPCYLKVFAKLMVNWKTLVLAIFVFIGSNALFSQNKFDGYWSGWITQVPTGIADRYYFSFEAETQGTLISGKTVIRIEDEMEIFGEMEFTGTWDGNQFKFIESQITNERIYNFAYWCKKSIQLTPVLENNRWVLKGSWNSDRCPGTGEIFLERPNPL